MQDGKRPKLIYFASRHPAFDRPAFIARWRQHAALGMAMPRWRNIHRYLHCDALPLPAIGLAPLSCDGVAIVTYRSEEARLAHVADRSAGPLLKQDELETFDRPVREVSLLTDSLRVLPATPGTPTLFLRLHRAATLAPTVFRSRWRDELGPRLAERLARIGAGYCQNHGRPLVAADPAPLLCDAVDEIACDDAVAAAAALRAALAETAAEGILLERCEAVWTRPTLLHGD